MLTSLFNCLYNNNLFFTGEINEEMGVLHLNKNVQLVDAANMQQLLQQIYCNIYIATVAISATTTAADTGAAAAAAATAAIAAVAIGASKYIIYISFIYFIKIFIIILLKYLL